MTHQPPRRIVMLTYAGANSIDTVGPLEVFSTADILSRQSGGDGLYRVSIVAPSKGPVRMQSGLSLIADQSYRHLRGQVDTLIVAGGDARVAARDTRLVSWVARMQSRVRRLCSVCTGAAVLASAGVLDGKVATTHWAYAGELATRHPEIEVDCDAIYVEQDAIFTSAGVTSGIDLALALVRNDHGHRLAMQVARYLVVFLQRPGGQSQFSTQLAIQSEAGGGELDEVLAWILDDLSREWAARDLADRAGMSLRNFFRVFERETGTTPARFIEQQRVEMARHFLTETDRRIEQVARSCGFRRGDRMRV